MRYFALVTLAAIGCTPPATAPAPLVVTVDKAELQANGADAAVVSAAVSGAAAGLVVSFSATGGFLSSSAAVPVDGIASVTLLADREDALLGRASKPVTVRATVTRSANDIETATVDLVFIAPTTGAPALSINATPAAAVADGSTLVTLAISARRLAPGASVSLSSSAGTLSSTSITLADDGAGGVAGSATLTAPGSPADALVIVREESGAQAQVTVPFVEDGAAQFDLTGTFAQMAPARVRLRAGTLEPNPQCIVAPAFVKVDVVQTGDVVDAVYTTCFVTLAAVTSIVGEVTNEAGPAFIGAIPVVNAHFTLAKRALGAVWDPPESVVVAGAELANVNDALPTAEDDARVRDSDGDGRPGVTVINSLAGEQNITFRNTGDTRGVVESSNRIVGATPGDLTALPESSVLSIGNNFLPDFESVPSVFELVRVDGQNGAPDMDTNGDGDVSCSEIVDAADFLFTVSAPDTPLDCAGVP